MEQDDRVGSLRMERTIGTLLRLGVILAGSIVLMGGVAFLFGEGRNLAQYRSFTGEPVELRTVGMIAAYAARLDSRGIIQFGLLLLIGIPVVRVAFSVFAFAREKDWKYVIMTMLVLSFLLFSLSFTG